MHRVEKKPEILFTISRNANESINTTYVPPSSRTINVGSKTTAQYNYLTKQNEYTTRQKYQTITEGGYTKETVINDLFLEIAALDVNKLNDTNITYPPIVWIGTIKRHVINPKFSND